MFTDVAGIALALAAIRIGRRPPNDARTFGWHRIEIAAAAVNAVLLFGVAAFVLWEAWRRLLDPPPVAGGAMLIVALLGLVGNTAALLILRGSQRSSLNMRGVYLEVLGDMLGSVAVVVAAAVIALTGFLAADAIASAAIGVMILPRTWGLLREALDVFLEAVPRGMRLEEVRRHLMSADGVGDVHDLHAWTITSGSPVVSAHVVLKPGADPPTVLDELCRCLSGDFDVEHSTLQLETSDRRPLEGSAHR